MDLSGTNVLVTGGASFIGSWLVEALVVAGARVRVVDDLSSGTLDNLAAVRSEIEFLEADLRIGEAAAAACAGRSVVFHLAADHGGRGYVELNNVACAGNLALDQAVFSAALAAGVDKVVYASSGCVYPNHLQTDPADLLYLTEEMAGPPFDPDGLYGLAKLAGELTLQAMHHEHGLAAASCRYFTVYGPRGVENHAVMAMIARAFIGEDPYRIWGSGEQVRNWTYVDDIVSGTMLAAERIDDGAAVNLGTMERVRVADAARLVLALTGHRADLHPEPQMPVGPLNRVADARRAGRLLGWRPAVPFSEGLARTVHWYYATKDRAEVERTLPYLLLNRPRTTILAR